MSALPEMFLKLIIIDAETITVNFSTIKMWNFTSPKLVDINIRRNSLFYCIVPYILIFDQNCIIALVVTLCHNLRLDIFYFFISNHPRQVTKYLYSSFLRRQSIIFKKKQLKYFHMHLKPFSPLHPNALFFSLLYFFQ